MDHADGNDDDVFIYTGGIQRVPQHVRYVRVHQSVKIIRVRAFKHCAHLVSIEMHDGVEIIEEHAFNCCKSLGRIYLPGVRVIGGGAFAGCTKLAGVEFGDKLETIGGYAFGGTSLRNIKLPKVRVIGVGAFNTCVQLTEVKLSKDLERVGDWAFNECPRLRRVAIPLKDNLLGNQVFYECDNLSQVDLIGGIHKTVSSLLLNSWREEMKNEIDRINQDLRNDIWMQYNKTLTIQPWMGSVLRRIEHYKNEHTALLKEFTTLLELALWKIKLDEEFGEALSNEDNESDATMKAKIDVKAVRQEKRITSGANIVLKNVLPFLKLE